MTKNDQITSGSLSRTSCGTDVTFAGSRGWITCKSRLGKDHLDPEKTSHRAVKS